MMALDLLTGGVLCLLVRTYMRLCDCFNQHHKSLPELWYNTPIVLYYTTTYIL